MNESQLEFQVSGVAKGQNALLLECLTLRRGQWVPLPLLVDIVGAYAIHSRASDLRRLGYNVENRRERHDGQVHSFYRLA